MDEWSEPCPRCQALEARVAELERRLAQNQNPAGEPVSTPPFTLQATAFPAFLETYQVGVLEGILRYCGERGRIRIAIDDLSTATYELHLL